MASQKARTKEMNKIGKLLEEIKNWQVNEMKNTCTICYGDNALTLCEACGWWGRVKPIKEK